MIVATTERLVLRWLRPEDADFILELLNDPGWIQHIGDRGIRTREGAAEYILQGPMAMYQREGFGLYLVLLRKSEEPVGMCGLIQRDTLEDVDLGFAFLERHCRQGYGFESARACVDLARENFGLERLVAITSPANEISALLLEKLGFAPEGAIRLEDDEKDVRLFGMDLTL